MAVRTLHEKINPKWISSAWHKQNLELSANDTYKSFNILKLIDYMSNNYFHLEMSFVVQKPLLYKMMLLINR